MKIIRLVIALMLVTAVSLAAAENNCVTCHKEFEDEDGPSYQIVRDVHFDIGLSCSDCHGGDPSLEDMDEVRESNGYRGTPSHLEVPDFCARCHSDAQYMREFNPSLPTNQLEMYRTSTHGKRLFGKKDEKVANCISCHGVHDIGNAKAPHSKIHPLNIPRMCGSCHANEEYMAEYGISTSQLADFSESVHGQALLENHDLGAPACNDCHGNHGAVPPGVSSLAAVCGNCHALEAELFNSSPHKEAFLENDFPMCETCHSNHKIIKPFDGLVGIDEPALCLDCHSKEDGTRGLETARGISTALRRLVSAHAEAKETLNAAKIKGMMTINEEFRLKEVKQILIQTRTLVHSFNLDSVLPRADMGISKADTVKVNSAALIEEYSFRRKGLGLATIFITILIIALAIKISRLPK